MKIPRILSIITISLVCHGVMGPARVYAQKTYTCIDCHSDLMQNEVKHAVVDQKGCNQCHKPTWKEHPGKKKGFELREKMPQLCIGCHKGVIDHKRVHTPVTEGNCTACHSPHSSSFPKLLTGDKKTICLNCHNKSLSKDNRPIINMLQLVQTRKYLHAALNGGCISCHLQHGSDYPKFLNAAFPESNYSPAIRDSFDLCFQCHDSDLLEQEFTTTGTNFRNGDKNLHFTHMNGDKARNCITCHDVHGSDNPRLIADKVPFGKWELPIRFSLQDSGGTCWPGCHGKKNYLR